MINLLKRLGRALIPAPLFRLAQPYYHGLIAVLSSYYFGRPGAKMTVIGVTGTAGKSTTVNLLAHILNQTGHKTGFITTANYSDGNREYVNKHGLSMPGGYMLQQQLRNMVNNGCQYAIVECTSEGLAQNRHLGISFTGALLTLLAPAHVEAHGSFDAYKKAKGKLFQKLKETGSTPTHIGVNLDSDYAAEFLKFPADHKFGITLKQSLAGNDTTVHEITEIVTHPRISFVMQQIPFQLNLIGEFNVYNAALAVACAHTLGVSLTDCATALTTAHSIAGRLQSIPNNRGINIYVDYAPEPAAMENSLRALNALPHNKIIHVFGSTGGHRDVRKRFEFGQISASLADTIIITNDDVYDSDPAEIARNVEQGISESPTKKVSDVMTVLDRRSAIAKALSIAQANDIVIITGKGSEQFLVLPGDKRIPWDEPTIVKEELVKLNT